MEQNITNFLYSVNVIDTETTNSDPENSEICQLASANFQNNWDPLCKFFYVDSKIDPASSAEHFITNRMLENCYRLSDFSEKTLYDLFFNADYLVAHNSEFDRKSILKNLKEKGFSTDLFETKNNFICTFRIVRRLYYDVQDIKFSLQFLRFYFDLDVPDNITAHRADADVITCGKLLEKLLVDSIEMGYVDPEKDIGPQLHKLSWDPLPVMYFPFGKHRGKKLTEIPNDYYNWALKNLSLFDETSPDYDYDLTENVRQVLEERLG